MRKTLPLLVIVAAVSFVLGTAAVKQPNMAEKVASKEELEAFRIKYLGTKGLLNIIMGEMKHVAPDKKKEAA